MSVVDSVEILRGRALTDDEYFKAAVLGWCIELVGPVVIDFTSLFTLFVAAPSILPRSRRHHGPVRYSSGPTMLVQK